MRRFLIAICLSTTVLLAGCATVTNPVTGKAERTVMDERSEMAEGAKAHPQILAEFGEFSGYLALYFIAYHSFTKHPPRLPLWEEVLEGPRLDDGITA
jgi:hypothetical protein